MPGRDRVVRRQHGDLLRTRFVLDPADPAVVTDQPAERLGHVRGVQREESHPAFLHMPLDPVDGLVADGTVQHVPPPGEDVGLREHLLRHALAGVDELGRRDLERVRLLAQAVGHRAVDVVRVHLLGCGVFGPHEDADLSLFAHDFLQRLGGGQGSGPRGHSARAACGSSWSR